MNTMSSVRSVVVLLLCAVACANGVQQSCLDSNKDPYLWMSSKTAYEFTHDNNATTIKYPGCEAREFWILSRHGTRYPGAKTIKKMVKDGPRLQAEILNHTNTLLCAADVYNLRAWQAPDISENDDEHLTTQGYLDLCFIARRFKQRFPYLLNVPYDKHNFKFRTTDSKRTKHSLSAFAECLFGSHKVKVPKPIVPDPLIETYEACPAYLASESANKAEANRFQNSSYVVEVLRNVNERLGYGSKLLTYDEMDLIYDLCRFEKAWNPTLLSPWCAAFSPEDLKVLEYLEDLKYYYTEGYGDQLNVDIGCPPVKDFVDRFTAVENGQAPHRGVFYFSHSTMLNMVMCRLGLYKDIVPPTSTNYPAMESRQWRSSLRGSFASNVAAVLYECSGDGEKWRFQLFVEERPVQLAGCPPEGLCSWQVVKKTLDSVQSCEADVTKRCSK